MERSSSPAHVAGVRRAEVLENASVRHMLVKKNLTIVFGRRKLRSYVQTRVNSEMKNSTLTIQSRIRKSRAQKYLSRLAPLALAFLLVLTCAPSAFATGLGGQVLQTDSLSSSDFTNPYLVYYFPGTDLATATEFKFKANVVSGTPTKMLISLWDNNTGTCVSYYTAYCNSADSYSHRLSGTLTVGTETEFTFPISGLNASHTYSFGFAVTNASNTYLPITTHGLSHGGGYANTDPYILFSDDGDYSVPSASITSPADSSTVSDFQNWVVTWSGQGTGTKQISVKYSDDITTLVACSDYPNGGDDYDACINSSPRIWVDYGQVTASDFALYASIYKNTPLVVGKLYHAQFVMQDTNSSGANLYESPIISFTVGAPTSADIQFVPCDTLDIGCHLKNWANWLFVPSDSATDSLFNFNLEEKAPFAYLYQLDDVWDELFNTAGTDINLTIPVFGHDLCLICTSRITALPFYDEIYDIQIVMMYFGTAMALYYLVKNMHSKVV